MDEINIKIIRTVSIINLDEYTIQYQKIHFYYVYCTYDIGRITPKQEVSQCSIVLSIKTIRSQSQRWLRSYGHLLLWQSPQHLHGGSQPSVTTVPGHLKISLTSEGIRHACITYMRAKDYHT